LSDGPGRDRQSPLPGLKKKKKKKKKKLAPFLSPGLRPGLQRSRPYGAEEEEEEACAIPFPGLAPGATAQSPLRG
jgi:hypothetical protein